MYNRRRAMHPNAPGRPQLLAMLVLSSILLPATVAGQLMGGFSPSEDYVVEVDGAASPKAKVYWSQSARSFLLVTNDLSGPVLVQPANRLVRGVPLMKLAAKSDGSIDILADAALTPKATLVVDAAGASFEADGHKIRIAQKPPLLGWQDADSIVAYSSMYATRAAAYAPQPRVVEDLLKQTEEVKLTVFFGSWCPFCQQKVPMAMKLASELEGSKVKVNFYGLDRSFGGDVEAKKHNIKSVPTGIVTVDGKEVGRINADGWKSVEATLNRLLNP